MRWTSIRTILVNDVRSTLRDRRTILMTFGLPVLLYPLLMIGASRLQTTQQQMLQARSSRVLAWGALPNVLKQSLEDNRALTLVTACDPEICPEEILSRLASGALPLPDRALDDAARERVARAREVPAPTNHAAPEQRPQDDLQAAAAGVLATKLVDAILVPAPTLGEHLTLGREGEVAVLYDSVRPESSEARTRLRDHLDALRLQLVEERERAAALPEGFGRALWTTVTNTATDERRAGFRLGALLPFLLIALSLLGGLYPAIELTAGEKERGTLQTLLCAPVRPLEIVTAKFLTVWITSMITAIVNIGSFGATLSRVLPADASTVGPGTLALALAILIPITFTTSAVFIAVATLARDFKDGQNLLTPVFLAVSLPAGLSTLPSMALDPWTATVPILNLALAIKAILSGEPTGALMLTVALSSVAFATAAVVAAARIFEQEYVLLGSPTSLADLLRPVPTTDGGTSPTMAFGAFAAILVAQFYGSAWLEGRPLAFMLLGLQVGLMLVPTLVVVAWARLDPIQALGLRWPSLRAVVGGVLVGISAWTLAMSLVLHLMPPPEGVSQAIERTLGVSDPAVPLVSLLLLAAVLPAICEETLFRGLLLNGAARWGRAAAVMATALAFALAHASIYRLLPTLLLGVLLGLIAWHARSIVVSAAAHATNNAVLLTLARYPGAGTAVGWSPSAPPPWWVVVAGAAVCAVGIVLVTWEPRHHDRQRRAPTLLL